MRFLRFALLALSFVAPMSRLAARETIGTFATWAAFCDGPKKCFAISQPVERLNQPFLSVAILGPTLQVQAYLGRATRAAKLTIGDEDFALSVSDDKAIADPAVSRRIVAAMRNADSATLVGTSAKGGRFRHHYSLAGAPSAIDAAAVARAR